MNSDESGKTPLRLQREEKGLTQAKAAFAAGLTEKSYRDIENGDVIPGLDTAVRIAETLGITLLEMAKFKGLDVSRLPEETKNA